MAAPAFRRPTDAATGDDEPDDLQHLLDAIPEVPHAAGHAAAAPEAPELRSVMQEIQRHMESAFGQGLARIEASFGSLTRDTDARVQAAQAQLQTARSELERARVEYERKVEALRELKRTLETL